MVLSETEWAEVEILWKSQTCGALVEHQEAVVIDGHVTVEAACEVLVQRNILSAPVKDETTAEIVGIFTYRVLVEAILAKLQQQAKQNSHPEEVSMTELLHNVGPGTPVSQIVKNGKYSSVLPEDTLAEAVEQFGNRVHRTAVVSKQLEFHGMLSQGMLLKFFKDQTVVRAHSVAHRSLKDLGMVKGTVTAISSDHMVVDAVKILVEHNISSIAVTNPKQRNVIVGAISLADVKYILKQRGYYMLWMNVERFLGLVKQQEAFTSDGMARDSYPVFTINARKSLGHTVDRLVVLRTHRLWIVGDDFVPCGVISITDIMRLLTLPKG